MRCGTCGHKFQQFEHYVESILYKEKMCENCFFDFALAKLGAKEKQMGYEEREGECQVNQKNLKI